MSDDALKQRETRKAILHETRAAPVRPFLVHGHALLQGPPVVVYTSEPLGAAAKYTGLEQPECGRDA